MSITRALSLSNDQIFQVIGKRRGLREGGKGRWVLHRKLGTEEKRERGRRLHGASVCGPGLGGWDPQRVVDSELGLRLEPEELQASMTQTKHTIKHAKNMFAILLTE